MRVRDSQRAKVYASDRLLQAVAVKLPEVADMERYVKRVCEMKRVQDAYPAARLHQWMPKVSDGRRRRRAGGDMTGIKMPVWARDEAIVLHELAHTITLRVHGWKVAAHGWEYCSVYLTLVLYAMGREAHDVLKAAFKKNRVRFTKPRAKKPMDPAAKAALVARLAAWRQQQKEAA